VVAAERRAPNEALAAASMTEGALRSSLPSLVLVTGASGFLGSAIAAKLRTRGHDVQTLVRPSSPRTNLDPRDTVREGDLRDRPSLAAALKGVRFLFHAAADYRLWARNPEEIHRNNVEGTRLIMEEALRAGVAQQRVVGVEDAGAQRFDAADVAPGYAVVVNVHGREHRNWRRPRSIRGRRSSRRTLREQPRDMRPQLRHPFAAARRSEHHLGEGGDVLA